MFIKNIVTGSEILKKKVNFEFLRHKFKMILKSLKDNSLVKFWAHKLIFCLILYYNMFCKELVTLLAILARETKGKDILVLDLSQVVSWTSYFCIVTALSKSHTATIFSKLEKKVWTLCVRKITEKLLRITRATQSQITAMKSFSMELNANCCFMSNWTIMDLGNVIVHIMTDQQRCFYDLEARITLSYETS